jgi:signal transduction histidine kinase/HD-like signal output (HDOD) protein
MADATDHAAPPPNAASAPSDPGAAQRTELILRQVDALPTLPAVATRLLRLTSDENADMRQVVRLIESDPALCAKVLALCSGAWLGVSRPVTTVDRAVVMMGMQAVRAAVLSVQVMEWSRQNDPSEPARSGIKRRRRQRPEHSPEHAEFDREGFWRHSIAVACCAELLCHEIPKLDGRKRLGDLAGEAFAAGLLHDVGKLALAVALPKAYGRLCALAYQGQSNIADIERNVLGLDHHTAGKRLAEIWGLPPGIRDAAWLHALRPRSLPASLGEDAPNPDAVRMLVGVVALADAVCRWLHVGWSGNFTTPPIAALCEDLEIEPALVELIAPRIHEGVATRCRDLGLTDAPSTALLLESVLAANEQLGRLTTLLRKKPAPQPPPAQGPAAPPSRSAKIIEALNTFHAALSRPGKPPAPEDVFSAVVVSAAGALGPGFYAGVYELSPLAAPDGGGPGWVLVTFKPDGTPVGASVVQPPAGPEGVPRRLGTLLDAAPDPCSPPPLAFGAWLGSMIGPGVTSGDLRSVRLAAEPGQAAVLVHDRLSQAAAYPPEEFAALTGAWSGALTTACAYERARRLSEELASTSAALEDAQSHLAEAQAMARLGALTAGAAHEMNNPLAIISGRAQQLAPKLLDPQHRAAAGAIVDAANRLTGLIRRLNLIASPPKPSVESVGVTDLLALVVRDAKERTQSKAARDPVSPVWLTVGEPVAPIWVDPGLMRLALVELVVNAIEAGAGSRVELMPLPRPGGGLLLRIKDDGPGLTLKARSHAFDPFFSDKPAGRQSGLGLPTARALIELHNGHIRLESPESGGTVAIVDLPGLPPPDQRAQRAAA